MNLILSTFMALALNASADFGAQDAARALMDEGVAPDEAARMLVARDLAPARAARAVAEVWSDCGATYAAVSAVVADAPDQARSVVEAVGSLTACGCDASELWARSRLEGRLRPPSSYRIVGVSDPCGCGTAAVEAASAVVPEEGEALVESALEIMQENGSIQDAVGVRGDASWGEGMPSNTSFSRTVSVCKADPDLGDAFDPSEDWETGDAGPGTHAVDCDSGDLIISEFYTSSRGDSFVELYNATDDEIDLGAERLDLVVYFGGALRVTQVIRLAGTVEPGQTVLVGPNGVVRQDTADQAVAGLSIAPGDALALRRETLAQSCECAAPAVGAALRGTEDSADALSVALGTASGNRICEAQSLAVLEQVGDAPVFFADEGGQIVPEPPGEIVVVDPEASPN